MSREHPFNPFAQPAPRSPDRGLGHLTSTVLGDAAAKKVAGLVRGRRIQKRPAPEAVQQPCMDDPEVVAYRVEKERIGQMVEHVYKMNNESFWLSKWANALALARILHASQIEIRRFLEHSEMWETGGGGLGIEPVQGLELDRITTLTDLGFQDEARAALSEYEGRKYPIRSDDMRYHLAKVRAHIGDLKESQELCERIGNFDQAVYARLEFVKALVVAGKREEAQQEMYGLYKRIREKDDFPKEEDRATLYAMVFATQCRLGLAHKNQLQEMDAYVTQGQQSTKVRLPGKLLVSMASASLDFQEIDLTKKYLERLNPQDGDEFTRVCVKLVHLLRDQGKQADAKIFIDGFMDRMGHFEPAEREGACMGWKSRLYAELGDLEEAQRFFDLMRMRRVPPYVSLFVEATLAAKFSDRLNRK